MANVITTQTLVDGPRNLVVRIIGTLDTSDETLITAVDPTGGQFPVSKVNVKEIEYSIEDALAVYLYWEATTNVEFASLTGRGEVEACEYGNIVNNAGAGRTGKILLSTQGWSTGAVLSFDMTIECVKSDK